MSAVIAPLATDEAQLPRVYENAQQALAECSQIDECQQWADKAAALRSYAKQAEDTTLMNHAQRIQARAVRRAGELLEQVEAGKGGRPPKTTDGADSSLSRRQVASEAGLSERQQYTAQRVARVPQEDFEAQVESDTPPTITALAEQGKKPHVANNSGNNEWYTPPQFIQAAHMVMGRIDLDPASSEAANKNVNAERFFTETDNGLEQPWHGRVFMNPPYERGLVAEFTSKLIAEHESGRVTESIVLVNNATETRWFQELAKECDAVCLVSGRIKYLTPELKPANTPLQGQAFIYSGPNAAQFCSEFGQFGVTLANV